MTTSTAELAGALLADPLPRPGRSLANAADELVGRIDAGQPIIQTLRTGVELLDSTAGGLVRGEFCGLAAAPGRGKSTVADAMVLGALTRNADARALVFNLETSTLVRLARMICGRSLTTDDNGAIDGYLPLGPLLRGELSAARRDEARRVANELAAEAGERLRFVDDVTDALEIAALIESERPDLVLIDHCGLLSTPGDGSVIVRFDDALSAVAAALRSANAAGLLIAEVSKAALLTRRTDLAAIRGSARFASLAGQMISLRRSDDQPAADFGALTPTRLVAELHKNRHGRGYVSEELDLFGGAGFAHWSGTVRGIVDGDA